MIAGWLLVMCGYAMVLGLTVALFGLSLWGESQHGGMSHVVIPVLNVALCLCGCAGMNLMAGVGALSASRSTALYRAISLIIPPGLVWVCLVGYIVWPPSSTAAVFAIPCLIAGYFGSAVAPWVHAKMPGGGAR